MYDFIFLHNCPHAKNLYLIITTIKSIFAHTQYRVHNGYRAVMYLPAYSVDWLARPNWEWGWDFRGCSGGGGMTQRVSICYSSVTVGERQSTCVDGLWIDINMDNKRT